MSSPCFCRFCPTVQKLGETDGETIIVKHQKREIKARLPVAIRCERCGKINLFKPVRTVEKC